ncbi:hypothetical protein CR513_36761, partial [Mucuna pruriens]
MATWEDLDLSTFEDKDEKTNLCLMEDTTSKDEDDEEITRVTIPEEEKNTWFSCNQGLDIALLKE